MKTTGKSKKALSLDERHQLLDDWLVQDKNTRQEKILRVANPKSQEFSGVDRNSNYQYSFIVNDWKAVWAYINYRYIAPNDPVNKLLGRDMSVMISMWYTDDIDKKKTLLQTLYL